MSDQVKAFRKKLPKEIVGVIEELNDMNISSGMIGGVVRDFLLNDKFSYDVDIELRSDKSIDMHEIAKVFNGLRNPEFQIVSFKIGNFSFELGLPRIERFHEGQKNHKNFDFEFVSDYYESFLRRDFTINTIMIEFNGNYRWIDPFDGIVALNEKVLHSCSDDFNRDPVRFLRAHRFKINLGFNFSEELQEKLQSMSIKNCSPFYIKKEAMKCIRPLSFLKAVGLILKIDENSIHDNQSQNLEISLIKEMSIEGKEFIFERLGLSTKSLIEKKDVNKKIENNQKLFSYFKKYKFSLAEVANALKALAVDYSHYDLDKILNHKLDLDLKDIEKSKRKSYIFSKTLEFAKK